VVAVSWNRESRRFSAWVEPESWHAWEGSHTWMS